MCISWPFVLSVPESSTAGITVTPCLSPITFPLTVPARQSWSVIAIVVTPRFFASKIKSSIPNEPLDNLVWQCKSADKIIFLSSLCFQGWYRILPQTFSGLISNRDFVKNITHWKLQKHPEYSLWRYFTPFCTKNQVKILHPTHLFSYKKLKIIVRNIWFFGACMVLFIIDYFWL